MSSALELVLSLLPEARRVGKEWVARCPAHEDGTPSLGICEGRDGRVLVRCRAGCSTEAVCAALGIRTSDLFSSSPPEPYPTARAVFGPRSAEHVWSQARSRVLDDSAVGADRQVYEYLDGRGLSEAWEDRTYGVLAEGMSLPAAVERWSKTGFRILAPLYDLGGSLASVQARRIWNGEPKTLFPKGGRARGVLFASALGQQVLKGQGTDGRPVILGEGLTDHLALSMCASVPVLCAPGVSTAESCVGDWARGRHLILALDCDEAGEDATRKVSRAAFEHGAARIQRVRWPDRCVDACDALWAIGADSLSDFLAQLEGATRVQNC